MIDMLGRDTRRKMDNRYPLEDTTKNGNSYFAMN